MIVMAAPVEFKHGFVRLEMVAYQQPGLLKLSEHAINGGQPRVRALFLQQLVDIFGGQMAHRAALEKLQYAQPRQGGLEPAGF